MDIDAIIDALGGPGQLQALLGVGPSAVSNYRARGAFPEKAKLRIWQALKARGITADPETLVFIGGGNNAPEAPAPPARATASPETRPEPRILLIITGGIAAYKALEVIRRLREQNIAISAILTRAATEFITPLSVAALTGETAYTELFSLTDETEMGHIRLARSAEAILVAPASADFMAKIAQGRADDLASAAILASDAPLMLAPAMNPFMWANPATQENCAKLQSRGVRFIGPDSGDMACGEDGPGRLAEPAAIVEAAAALLPGNGALTGMRALVTSGPTHEPIDAVRYIANRSSGKQGHAIAAALARHGARVTLITGPVNDSPPPGAVQTVAVTTAEEMLTATLAVLPCDIAVCAAAVGDWRVENARKGKLKKPGDGDPPPLELAENPDILATISRHKGRPRLVVGFAAETEAVVANATQKRLNKECDWILANDVSGGAVFGEDSNEVHFITADTATAWPSMSKTALAEKLVAEIVKELTNDTT